jgi:hypothetical protein
VRLVVRLRLLGHFRVKREQVVEVLPGRYTMRGSLSRAQLRAVAQSYCVSMKIGARLGAFLGSIIERGGQGCRISGKHRGVSHDGGRAKCRDDKAMSTDHLV